MKKLKNNQYFQIFINILAICNMVFALYFFFIMDYQTKWLAKNPNNIQTGCLYFLNENKGMIVQVGD